MSLTWVYLNFRQKLTQISSDAQRHKNEEIAAIRFFRTSVINFLIIKLSSFYFRQELTSCQEKARRLEQRKDDEIFNIRSCTDGIGSLQQNCWTNPKLLVEKIWRLLKTIMLKLNIIWNNSKMTMPSYGFK